MRLKAYPRIPSFVILLLLTVLGMWLQGYHPGAEDDGVYLAAIKKDLNPVLYPHDADFFKVQLQATIFDKVIARSVRLTHLPVASAILAWQFISIFLILWGCLRISERIFDEAHAQWAAVALIAALLTLPVAGTALYIDDQYLHPRALATAAILAAIAAVLDRRRVVTGLLLVLAFVIHPLMASFGISFCIFLSWPTRVRPSVYSAAALPLAWVFQSTSPAWQQAANTRDYYFLSRWQWYEWLGVVAPLFLLGCFYQTARREDLRVDGGAAPEGANASVGLTASLKRCPDTNRGYPHTTQARALIASRAALFGVFQFIVALAIMLPPSLQRLRPFQPMRYLHLLYILLFLLIGGTIGQKILRRHAYRWALLFIPLGVGMFWAQRLTFPATPHFEWPGAARGNAWVEAFQWVRDNTPSDSLFALDPYYMKMPGEDFHSFRALAERSVLADYVKDASVATQVPSLSGRWKDEVDAQGGWKDYHLEDFQRLRARFGVNWVVVASPGVQGLECPFRNRAVLVCRIPGAN
jgi:hypothetical protein